MAFCQSCGAALSEGVGFCSGCGKPASAAAAAGTASSGLTMNMAAALAYFLGLITGVLFLVLEPYKNDRRVRFHAMQSIFISIACFVLAILWNMVAGLLVSIAGFWLLPIDAGLRFLVSLALFVYWIFLMFQAYHGREYRIPWIGDLAAGQVH